MKLLLLVVFGLIWGSFLSVVRARIDNPRSIAIGRSRCPKCGKVLSPIELFPIVSYIVLLGRCRGCKSKISIEYPLLEILSVSMALLSYYIYGISYSSAFLFLSLSFILVASIEDYISQEVDVAFFALGILFALSFVLSSNSGIANHLLGSLSAVAIPLGLFLVSKEKWMGLGDSFFALWMGLILGYPLSLIGIFIAFFVGAIFGIIKLIVDSKDRTVAFGPFLFVGCIVALLSGQVILNFYLNILNLGGI